MVEKGFYKHFKGGLYVVLGLARHTITEEDLVLYAPRYDSEHTHFVRPISNFLEIVEYQGQKVPRFVRVL